MYRFILYIKIIIVYLLHSNYKTKIMKEYNDLTEMQKLVSKAMNSYSDNDFIEMVENLDETEFWQELILDELTDEECVRVLSRLLSMFRDWNLA